MLLFITALAFLAATGALARFSPRTPWPVFTTAGAIAMLWIWVLHMVRTSAPAEIQSGSELGPLAYAVIASAIVMTILLGAWAFVAAMVPAGRTPRWQFLALAGGGAGLIAIALASANALWEGRFTPVFHVPVLVAGLGGTVFAGYLAYGKLYSTVAHSWLESQLEGESGPNAVIVLGARLVDGQLTELLARRVELGVEIANRIWLAEPATDRALLVLSGGSPDAGKPGPAESHAMSEHAVAFGASRDLVVVEDQSTTTAENFRFSARLLDERGVREPYVGVTNGFHAYRAALHMNRAGVDGQVIGGASGAVSAPFHVLREFAAFFYEIIRRG